MSLDTTNARRYELASALAVFGLPGLGVAADASGCLLVCLPDGIVFASVDRGWCVRRNGGSLGMSTTAVEAAWLIARALGLEPRS